MRALLLTLALAVAACSAEGPAAPAVRDISAEQLLSSPPENALILDVRSAQEFGGGHVPGAVNIPHDELTSRLAELGPDRERPVVVYCERGGRAGNAADVLHGAGYTDLRHLEGDMSAWRAALRPME